MDLPEGLDQGLLVEGHRRLLFVSGQCAVSPDGESLHPGDMGAQTAAAPDNVEAVLERAGTTLSDIVRMNTYVTDVDDFSAHAGEALSARLEAFGVRPPGVLAGIARLGRPELLVELEVVAAD